MGAGSRPRLLLLEFVSPERWVFDSRYFGHFRGLAEALDLPARWLTFGARFRLEKTGEATVSQSMGVEGEALQVLRQHVAELGPTHVIVSHPLTAATRDALDAAGTPAVLCMSDLPPGERCESFWDLERAEASAAALPPEARNHPAPNPRSTCWRQGRTDWLLDWLGVGDAPGLRGAYFVDGVTPAYDALMANAEAAAFKPHLIVMGGVSCDHFGRVDKNAHYAGVDFDGIEQAYGCSYCTWYRGPTSDLGADPLDAFEAQLRRVQQTARGRLAGFIDVHDIRLFRNMERFADRVLAVDLPPTTFCFEPRLDRYLQAAASLGRALPRLAARGHSVYLFRMGAESLVEEENRLYNKHVTLAQIDEATRSLRALAAAHPGAFDYDPTWGYISVSPWTTLEMMELGLERAQERGFEPLGVWLYTPLLLYRGAPITRLAERQGLLVERFEDLAFLYEASVNQVRFDCFVPYRFGDERTGVAFGLVVRFCAAALRDKYPDTIFAGDPLYARLLSHEGQVSFARPDLFAAAVMKAIRQGAAPYDREAILEIALATLPRAAAAEPPQQMAAGANAPAADRRAFDLFRAVCHHHARDVRPLDAQPPSPQSDGALRLRFLFGGREYELHLSPPSAAPNPLFATSAFAVTYDRRTPLTAPSHLQRAREVVALFERALANRAPDLLPGQPSQRSSSS